VALLDIFRSKQPEPAADTSTRRRFDVGRAVARMFKAAESDRLTSKWGTTPITADYIISQHQRVLVARSREQVANNDYAKAFLRMCRQNIVGPQGIMLHAEAKDPGGRLDEVANQALELFWKDWSRRDNCDVTGKQSFRSLLNTAINSAARDGEFFFKKIRGRDAGKWRFALQQIDAQRCPPDFDVLRLENGNHVRAGIEFNEYGRPIAYYFTTLKSSEADYIYGGRAYLRIPAADIIHGFEPDMVGQRRGLPWMATALWRLHMLGGMENAALVNARVSAAKGGFFQWREGYGPEQDEDEEIYMEAEPGSFQELPAGVEFKEWNPQYPSGEFAPFVKNLLRGAAAGLGVSYNNLASDLEGVNYSSIRQGTLDEREHWKELQEWLIECLVQPVWQELLPIALLVGIPTAQGGTLRAENLAKYSQITWQPRRWQWIDPRADVEAAIKSKNNLLASPGQIMREQGKDPDNTWREWAADIQAMKQAGIPDKFIELALGMKAEPAPAPVAATEPQGGEDDEE
jgi:lambda family phage portal protein